MEARATFVSAAEYLDGWWCVSGKKGDIGSQGPAGDTGCPGQDGNKGQPGPKGEIGADGPKGKTLIWLILYLLIIYLFILLC